MGKIVNFQPKDKVISLIELIETAKGKNEKFGFIQSWGLK
jgi:hypothetical protein